MRRASRAEIVQQLSKGRSAVADFSRNSARTPEESGGPDRATNSAKGGLTGESAGDAEPETVHGFEHEPNASLTNVPGQNGDRDNSLDKAPSVTKQPEPLIGAANATGLGDVLASPADIAQRYDLPLEPLQKRLGRWRQKHDEGWKEVTDRKPREPQFLYKLSAVSPIIEEMASRRKDASSEASSHRPAK
jgi:hypothetical protein